MAETVTMPKLGFDMQEGTLVRWVKAENEQVARGDVLAEIETDKATVEVESSFTGVVLRQLVGQGDIVPVGAPIAIIGEPGENVTAGGDQATEPRLSEEENVQPTSKISAQPQKIINGETAGDGRLKVSPLARRIAAENGIDLRQVKGNGPSGRIVRSDVEAAIASGLQLPATASVVSTPLLATTPPVTIVSEKSRDVLFTPAPVWSGQISTPQDEVVKVSRLRSAISRRMVESKTHIPHFYVTRTYKFEKLMQLRSQLNAYLPDDEKISVNDFIIKATALTLRQFPNVNASLLDDEIVRHGRVNIGSAVSLDSGLMTVVIKDADQKPLRLISTEMRELVVKARIGKVRPEDIEGSTFSISNMGMYDVDHFVAIVNPPEVGILAVGSAMQTPVVEDGELKVGMRLKATISLDHRVSDGAEAARFMQVLAAYLEEPIRLML